MDTAKVTIRTTEIDNIVAWAVENNFRLNKSKSIEILFRDNRWRKFKFGKNEFNIPSFVYKEYCSNIIQGSHIGPAAYTVTAGDLDITALSTNNSFIKFTDAAKVSIGSLRSTYVTWAAENNCRLNKS